ncbi:hypothetical protein MLD38_030261 [Melastoma candidum]|uniref:Uncharacterized protein n=1 Tax=Melastoma candidum TaxID=119954 RepID=A0ACB9MKR6_9MYRT|nr:hypothetical protein MLD38_030261 [Melastoma candidum]
MDATVSSAVLEICSAGAGGISLAALFSILRVPEAVKPSLYSSLLSVPNLQFRSSRACFSPDDPAIASLDTAERLGVKVIANEGLRDNFVGLYDAQSAVGKINDESRRILERLAVARTNGVPQCQLAKEFQINWKKVFYIVKGLESRGLVVRHRANLKSRESSFPGGVETNVVYLHRYAKQLGLQQKLEVTMGDQHPENLEDAGDGIVGDILSEAIAEEDVVVRDDFGAMKAICDMLEAAEGKVLVVSDIKRNLDYRKAGGHRSWRRISLRLKQDGIVKEFQAKVNGKAQTCLQLLKCLCKEISETPNSETELVNFGRKAVGTDLIAELPLEHQAFEIIDAAGEVGHTSKEVLDMLGLKDKRNHDRLHKMFSRFGMDIEAQRLNRGAIYRVRTPVNSRLKLLNAPSCNSLKVGSEEGFHHLNSVRAPLCLSESEKSVSVVQSSSPERYRIREANGELCDENLGSIVATVLSSAGKSPDSQPKQSSFAPDSQLGLTVLPDKNVPGNELLPSRSRQSQSDPRYHCLLPTEDAARREQIILERLQIDKFILRAELYRLLVSFEKDKRTKVDRKTIDRIIIKLQKQGLCKCIELDVPTVTNCNRTQIIKVFLHPSIQELSPEVVGQIHNRHRAFEMQTRGHGSLKLKSDESLPVLGDIQRIPKPLSSNSPWNKSEAMRANGFVLSKMVRAKLLHRFFWEYVRSSTNWEQELIFGKSANDVDHFKCHHCLFPLDGAIKAIPFELFLQVAGSTHKFEDMTEKCNKGLRLCDLSPDDYEILMTTLATGRLSIIVDILRRLKLIRLVKDQRTDDMVNNPYEILTHALELKPYIEEPSPTIPQFLNLESTDLRPRIRHDFFLLTREDVDEYWHTLEYCYAATDPKAAINAFPGSTVHEVFLFRSWASARVMTAKQRAELANRVVVGNNCEKLSFRECEKIATDLNLTLEQVLRVYYDKRRQLNKYKGVQSASRKRKRSSKEAHLERKYVGASNGSFSRRNSNRPSTSSDQSIEAEDQGISSVEEYDLPVEDNNVFDYEKGPGPECQDEGRPSCVGQPAVSRTNIRRQKKFFWTDELDRQLVTLYVRNRAILGAKYHRTDWGSLADLPGPPGSCRRRMAILNGNRTLRKMIMRLCNLLGERYIKHLQKIKDITSVDGGRLLKNSRSGDYGGNSSDVGEHDEQSYLGEDRWDDFENQHIKKILEDILHLKKMNKLDISTSEFEPKEWSNVNLGLQSDSSAVEFESVADRREGVLAVEGKYNYSRRHRVRQKFVKLWKDGLQIIKSISESLAVSNAIELFKLVFLTSSTTTEVPHLLAGSLRRYSEHDLFAAFNYLKDKKILVGGNGDQPFELSQTFLQDISKSKFPFNSGKRVVQLSRWLQDKENDLSEGETFLTDDLHCGDVTYIFSLIYSGEYSISPSLPKEGVGEAADTRNKRKPEGNQTYDVTNLKKLRTIPENEVSTRREKGFPGIRLSLRRAVVPQADVIQLFKDEDPLAADLIGGKHCTDISTVDERDDGSYCANNMREVLASVVPNTISEIVDGSLWEVLTNYVERVYSTDSGTGHQLSIKPEAFKAAYSAIQKAGDQGLSIEEIKDVFDNLGETMISIAIAVEVLQSFDMAMEVNDFDTVRIVDSRYRSKYFLSSAVSSCQGLKQGSSPEIFLQAHRDLGQKNGKVEQVTHRKHKITILNSTEEIDMPMSDVWCSSLLDRSNSEKGSSSKVTPSEEICVFSSSESFIPILPWINGDGTINRRIYRGLLRRVLGIVMLNPGILEEDIIRQVDILNPQSCRDLLKLMVLDKHLVIRKMHQTQCGGIPGILEPLLGDKFRKSEPVFREHFFANPSSCSLL